VHEYAFVLAEELRVRKYDVPSNYVDIIGTTLRKEETTSHPPLGNLDAGRSLLRTASQRHAVLRSFFCMAVEPAPSDAKASAIAFMVSNEAGFLTDATITAAKQDVVLIERAKEKEEAMQKEKERRAASERARLLGQPK
jgi:hypothetical protein